MGAGASLSKPSLILSKAFRNNISKAQQDQGAEILSRLLTQIVISPFFGTLTITLLFQSSRILSLVHTLIHIRNSHSTNLSPPAFSVSPVMLSYPAALFFLRFLTDRSTSILVGGLNFQVIEFGSYDLERTDRLFYI